MKYRKILLAYNGSAEGKRALLERADLASFLSAETHLLAVASMPPSLFLTEGFVPEELLEEEKKRTQTVLDEGIATLNDARLQRRRPPRGGRAGGGDLPRWRRKPSRRPDRRRPQPEAPPSRRAGGRVRWAPRCSTTRPAASWSRCRATRNGTEHGKFRPPGAAGRRAHAQRARGATFPTGTCPGQALRPFPALGPRARAKSLSIDASPRSRCPGVIAVLTGEDVAPRATSRCRPRRR